MVNRLQCFKNKPEPPLKNNYFPYIIRLKNKKQKKIDNGRSNKDKRFKSIIFYKIS